jgi:hypothetical protein
VEFYGQVRHGSVHVHPRCVAEELASEDSAVEAGGLEAALREHSEDLSPAELNALLAEIGEISG